MSIRRFAIALPAALLTAGLVASTPAHAADTGPEAVPSISGVTPPAPRGSLPVGTARYPIPAGAVFVDSGRGSDTSPGTIGAPVRTVAKALGIVRYGGTIVLRAGSYNERAFIGKPVVLQSYPGEAAWFDGTTPLRSWTATGVTWESPFATRFDHSTPSSSDAFVGPQNPMAAWPEMVFVDGRRITQVTSNPRGEQFAVDQTRGKVVMGFDPDGKDIRVTNQTQAVVVGSPDVTLRGFGVRRFANSVSTYGALYLARPRTLAENIVVEDVATTGVTLDSDGVTGSGTIDRVTVRRAGMLGIHGNWADGGRILNSVVLDANYERFNSTPTAAGMKICRTRGITIDNNKVTQSRQATGIWLDEAVVGFRVTRNLVGGNGDTGITAELSSSGTIASNQVVGHEQGIVLYNTEKTLVQNNTMGFNSRADLYMIQDWRRQSQPGSGQDPRYSPGDPTNTWLLRDNTVRNNLFGDDGAQKSMFQVYVMDRNTGRSADSMNITFAGNAFSPRTSANSPAAFGWGNADNSSVATFDTPEAFQAAKRFPPANRTLRNTEFGHQMDEARSLPESVPLPTEQASALGARTGMRVTGSLTG